MVYAVKHVQLCMVFSSRAKPKHRKLAGCQHTASPYDEQHYRTVRKDFMLTNSICDFFHSNFTVQCWLVLVIFYLKQLVETSRLLDPIFKNKLSNNDK